MKMKSSRPTKKRNSAEQARSKRSKSAESPDEFRAIAHVETSLHEPIRERWTLGLDEGGVRLWCTASPRVHGDENARWALQVRAKVKPRRGGEGKRFALGTASMSRRDLLWLRTLIDAVLEGS